MRRRFHSTCSGSGHIVQMGSRLRVHGVGSSYSSPPYYESSAQLLHGVTEQSLHQMGCSGGATIQLKGNTIFR